MSQAKKIADWLETHWVTPAYSGWLLGGLTLFFFMAATNTLAGWLYVISGISFALLAIAAILPERVLNQLKVQRQPIYPVSVGDPLTIELLIENPGKQPKTLLQVQDMLPYVLGQPVTQAIETIAPGSTYHWSYSHPTQRRGVYRWQTVQLRTAAPLGLFWCRRAQTAKAVASVYPAVLPLTQCPLVDEMGRDLSLQLNSDRRAQSATEGLTRSVRPYRWGDPIRLIHWRTSARYGELRVRELEIFTGGQELVICLDSAFAWLKQGDGLDSASFEQAVVAAASLYFYACQQHLQVRLWTAGTGLVSNDQAVLEALAATQPGEDVRAESLPTVPLIWLTQNPTSLNTLPAGSRWIFWTEDRGKSQEDSALLMQQAGLLIQPEEPLQLQLQQPLSPV